ncbi:MAG: GHMP kinase, partial [Chloroflexia bacterium]|nr:GHMP kinase [Chloroflexia bacterium]
MRHTTIPDGFAELVPAMAVSYRQILHALTDHGIVVADYPRQLPPANLHGIAAARAYPMQGVLKYHGLADWQQRIAFLPSISVNNDAAQTVTIVEFDPSLEADTALFG